MDEDVLVLGLYHVVALRAETRHVAVDVDAALVLDALQHRVDDDEGARAAHASAVTSQHNSTRSNTVNVRDTPTDTA